MTANINDSGQVIGEPLTDWEPAKSPSKISLKGQYCYLEPLSINHHAKQLYDAYAINTDLTNWTYLLSGPFNNFQEYTEHLRQKCGGLDPLFFTVLDKNTQQAIGVASLMRINQKMGVIEVGNIHFSPVLQRTPLSTEAMYLMMKYVFDDLGYRRYEWKCDSLNKPSRNAAKRLGFTYEGTFRQAVVSKGRNRDTAWFSIIDKEWPALKLALQAWLNPTNFDIDGKQRKSLDDFQETVKI